MVDTECHRRKWYLAYVGGGFRCRGTFEHAHHSDEEQSVHQCSETLIKNELDGCISDGQPLVTFLMFLNSCAQERGLKLWTRWEVVLEELLPAVVRRRDEQREKCKME